MKNRPSVNFDHRPPDVPIDMLVLHYTGMASAEAAMQRLCDPLSRVSAHYVIDEDGAISQLVDEDRRAWHAGQAIWRGRRDVNGRSIGIELVNPGHQFGLRPFPDVQMQSLQGLAMDITGRHPIAPRNVVGHSDVAPRRKEDPGELFDWFGLYQAGIGVWPEPASPCEMNEGRAAELLEDFGYETIDLSKTLAAFQRRFRPAKINARLDCETAGLLDRLAAAVG